MHVLSDKKEYKFKLLNETTFFIHLQYKKPNQSLSYQIKNVNSR